MTYLYEVVYANKSRVLWSVENVVILFCLSSHTDVASNICSLGSNVIYDDSMNLRNILWLAPMPSNSTKAWSTAGTSAEPLFEW